jgi:predicted lysophospholipase L1 biosynthesis ABC-type transport system permease subunit
LLSVPFASGFDDTTAFERDVYLVALLSAALSSALLIAPTAYHRLMFERGEKEWIVDYANRCAIIGLTFLAIAMVASVLLVASFLFGGVTAAVCSGAVAGVFGWLWFGLGWWRRRTRPSISGR